MENASASDNRHPEPEAGQQQESRQFNRSRGRNRCQYNDLRELLTHKRHTQHDSAGNGPPPEPGYNFLADPLRDNDPDARSTGDRRPENYGSGRFSPRQHSTVIFENRNRGRGRGRASSFWKDEQPRQPGGEFRRDNEWKEERNRVDKERMQRQRSDTGGWKREWDAGKEEMWKDHRAQPHSPPHRPATGPPPNRRYRAPQPRQEGGEQPQEQGNVDTANENNVDPRPTRKFYGDNSRGGNQYRPPPPPHTKYNPNYQSRGGRGSFQRPTKPRRPNPMNITVEFSADTGERICTIGSSKPGPKSRPKRANRVRREPAVPDSENWNDDYRAAGNVEKAVENVSAASKDETGAKLPVETVADEQCEEGIGDNEGAEYDDANEEQYTDAEEKNTGVEEKHADAGALTEEQIESERTKAQTASKAGSHESELKECDNSQAKDESKQHEEVKQKEKDLQTDSTNVVAEKEKGNGEEAVKTAEVKPECIKQEETL